MPLDCAITLPWTRPNCFGNCRLLPRAATGLIIQQTFRWAMRHFGFVILLSSLAPAATQAQVANDLLTGRVTDLGGHPIADARVGATSLGTGRTRSQTTDENGRFRIYFPETAPRYILSAKRIGFTPVERTISRRTAAPEKMTIDLQFGATPVALSVVEVNGHADAPVPLETAKVSSADASVPNPVADILALKDTLHLSAVQIVALGELSDSLQLRNTTIYHNIQTLLAKSQAAGDATQMAGSVALMLEEASGNTTRAVSAAEKLLQPEQWMIVPSAIRERAESSDAAVRKE
jgi:carboxypeptidase family protein